MFSSRLTPGSVVGYKSDPDHYLLGMVVGMHKNGRQVALEPGVVDTPEKKSISEWRKEIKTIYVDYEDILFHSYEHKYSVPVYWLDWHAELVSPTMRPVD